MIAKTHIIDACWRCQHTPSATSEVIGCLRQAYSKLRTRARETKLQDVLVLFLSFLPLVEVAPPRQQSCHVTIEWENGDGSSREN